MAVVELRVIIDAREALVSRRTGKGQWARGCIDGLLARGDTQLTLLAYAHDCQVPTSWLGRVRIEGIPGTGLQWQVRVLRRLWRERGSVYLSPLSFIVPALLGWRLPCAPVVHDLIAFRDEPHDRRATRIERWTLPWALRWCRAVLAVSEQTQHDLLQRFPSLPPARVQVCGAASRGGVAAAESDGNFILCVGTLCPRKNQLRLLQAYERLPSDVRSRFRLVLAGARGWDDEAIITAVQATAGAEWRGYIDDATYAELLHHCRVFALPSLYEGFGLQLIDALQAGVPIVTSHHGSLQEVVGDAAVIVDPLAVDDIARGLFRALTDEQVRKRLRAAGPIQASRFSWDRTAALVRTTLERVASRQ